MSKFKLIARKRHLEMELQKIPGHPNPKIELEQYMTPSFIASDLLWNAYTLDDIFDKNIIDLGCGSGIFAIGSILLGANYACGIDIDSDVLHTANEFSKKLYVNGYCDFIECDVNDLSYDILNSRIDMSEPLQMDVAIQNPPFGSQSRVNDGADRIFMEKSMELADVSYSFHMAETENFIENYFLNLGAKITHKFYYSFPLPNIYSFHKMETKYIDVVVVRAQKIY